MSSLNRVQIIGRLGADPETRTFQNGGRVVNFRVATSERWKDKQGVRQERTEWTSVAVFNEHLAEVAEKYLRKGSLVYVEGQLETRRWSDQSGQDRYSTEVVLRPFRGAIVLLGGRDGDGRDSAPRDASTRGGGRTAPDLDDAIPFAAEWRV